jgi:hypothetical protein
MRDPTPLEQTHPRGTLFLIGLYGLLFVAGWFAVYVFVYLRRGVVTP